MRSIVPGIPVGPRRALPLILLRPVVEHRPIEDEIVLDLFAAEQVLHQPAEQSVVGSVLEPQAPAVAEIGDELCRKVLAKGFDGCRHLLLHDLLVFLLLADRAKALPRQGSAVEIHQHVADGLQVVPSALLDAEMGIDRRVPRSSGQVLVLPVGNVLLAFRISVLLGEPEIDHVDHVRLLSETDQEIIRFDIPMQKVLGVHVLHPVDHLVREHHLVKRNGNHFGEVLLS